MLATRQLRAIFTAALALSFLPGCAGYTSATRKGLDEFAKRDFAEADKEYAKADQNLRIL